MKKLATIGYEGADLADFVATLSAAKVRRVVDVRELPLSRRKGFSKSQLSKKLETVGIEYSHYRELGDPKDGRIAARSGDFDRFRAIYFAHLKRVDAKRALKEVLNLAWQEYSCLLCFERDPNQCHRTIVAQELMKLGELRVIHLGVRAGVGNGSKFSEARTRGHSSQGIAAAQ